MAKRPVDWAVVGLGGVLLTIGIPLTVAGIGIPVDLLGIALIAYGTGLIKGGK